MFGYLLEGTGIWTSCWMFMFFVSLLCLVWMHRVIAKMTKRPKGFESQYADASRVLPGDELAPLMQWRDGYSVGNEAMDQQHRRLIALINELDEVIQKGCDLEQLSPVLDSVIDYTKTHFASEEAFMEKIGYPDLENHKEAHRVLVRQVMDLREEVQGCDPEVIARLFVFLQTWLVSHIVGVDNKYGVHAASQR